MWVCKCGNQCDDTFNFCDNCGLEKPAEPESNNGPWYYANNGIKVGPVSNEQILVAIKDGIVVKDTLVWRSGFSDWRFAENTSLKNSFYSFVPPLTKSAINDKWLWCIVTIPFFVDILLNQLIGFAEGIWIVSSILFILQSVFLVRDIRYLRGIGYDHNNLYWGLILIPMYLFVRAAKTNKNFWPAIIWCILHSIQLLLELFTW